VRILFVGDVVGEPGRRILERRLRPLRDEIDAHLVVVNGENGAAGSGLTPSIAEEIFRAGADVITSGNHIWSRKEILPYLDRQPRLLRPANYPGPAPGRGACTVSARDGTAVSVLNLIGRVFLDAVDDPFRAVDALLAEAGGIVLVDFHAEATSEKVAFGWYLDGRVSAVVGTHTHVPTADARVLPGGTAYITDVGMTGPYDSVIGVEREAALERFRTQRPVRFSPARGDVRLAGVLIDVDGATGHALSIARIERREDEQGARP
jgi:metallophosphoesterase (TIGR00282 family)